LRYQQATPAKTDNEKAANFAEELAFLRLRYKAPHTQQSLLIEHPILNNVTEEMNTEVTFSLAVAAFGQLLRGGEDLKDFSYDAVLNLARTGRGEDHFGYRAEFINLVALAKALH
jgi:Ca-activated chloride channel family protein